MGSSRAEVERPAPTEIVNVSDLDPQWNWLAQAEPGWRWRHVSSAAVPPLPWLGRPSAYVRAVAARRAVRSAGPDTLLVSHGPRPTMHTSIAVAMNGRPLRHLAYAFTFTQLPTGARHKLMARAFRQVDRFVSFSSMERALYAGYFDLDIGRFDMHLWAVRPPVVAPGPPVIAGDYVCAVGSQGRDYAPLVAAMRRLPSLRLVIVAEPAAMRGVSLPENVQLMNGLPLPVAMNIVRHSRFSAIALRDAEVPCGHVTIVSAMHLGRAVVCTASRGVEDYVFHRANGLTVPPGDPQAWVHAIEELVADPSLRERLGAAALDFAQRNCSESVAHAYLRGYLGVAPGGAPAAAPAFAPAA